MVFVLLEAATTEVLEAAGAPFLAWKELFWSLGASFVVEEEVWGKDVALEADSFSCWVVTEGLQSPAMGTVGSRGRLVRAGCVSILERCSSRAVCCLRSWCR